MSSWQNPQNPRPDEWTWNPQQSGGAGQQLAQQATGTGPQQPATGGHAPGNTFGAPSPTATLTAPHAAPKRSRAAMFLASTALAAVVGAGAGIGGYALIGAQYGSATPAVSAVPVAQPSTLDGTVTAAAQTISPSVVTITVMSSQGESIGSGVILDTSGHILTNEHVVSSVDGTSSGTNPTRGGNQASASITVTFEDGSTAEASVVGTSTTQDLAVIKVSDAKASELKPATFAESSSVVVGQSVVAVGAPLGLSETVTSGIVSATARPVRSGTTGNAVYRAVQTDAAINPGNSGGPLVNLNGQVIGIDAAGATLSSSESEESGSIGLGFAIPADVAVRVANDLIADGTAPDATLGVQLRSDDSSTATTSDGVDLSTVVSGGAADQAGLRSGDVVTSVDGVNVTSADGLIAAIRYHAPGDKVTVGYTRDGQAGTAEVTLGTSS
ncbi:S1C family serine protease [Micropruina sonneratiae]|uniref:S1C family serine protease n=1 Tax=Micropruina sonneratiae TaxID=2986940 RepID=UPI002226B859|nr:trypsin-like peptidase domain-containing protein [Micropruina sp. KQZ13P-5]MCW3158474.1 trypsin-like peptidase domain-containing protein [Micropruina sp. KQZ13P-5]